MNPEGDGHHDPNQNGIQIQNALDNMNIAVERRHIRNIKILLTIYILMLLLLFLIFSCWTIVNNPVMVVHGLKKLLRLLKGMKLFLDIIDYVFDV